jgi:hypothetical protein
VVEAVPQEEVEGEEAQMHLHLRERWGQELAVAVVVVRMTPVAKAQVRHWEVLAKS